jgi:hypothetical protein
MMNRIIIRELYRSRESLYKNNLIGLAKTQIKSIKNVTPDAPKYPSPADCCMSGCKHCDYVLGSY